MRAFITENFLLETPVARELYHEIAAHEPIFDYHCHLPPDQIAANKQFRNLYEIWLAGDHYKWRAMRSDGVPEKYCTGDASDWEKFLAFARTVPHTLRNPLYHWTHIELKRFFGITQLLDESTAKEIWDEANEKLASMPVQRILETNRVVVVCTTDDPTDSLEHHRRIRESGTKHTRVYPAFRPDKALAIDQPAAWIAWLDKLGECPTLQALLGELVKRLDFFHTNGCRLSDHGLNYAFADDCTEAEAARVFDAARAGRTVSRAEANKFRSFVLLVARRTISGARLGHAAPSRRHAQQQHADDAHAGTGHGLRLDRRLAAGGTAGPLPRQTRPERPSAEDHPLQPQSRGQLRVRHHARQFPGRQRPGQTPVGQRLVVPGPAGRHGVADQRTVEPRLARAGLSG